MKVKHGLLSLILTAAIIATVAFFTSTGIDASAAPIMAPDFEYSPFGDAGATLTSTDEENGGGTLSLTNGKNGSATFDPGTCDGLCTIGVQLPIGASNALPGDEVATMYVRVVDEDGQPGEGSYTVCFSTEGLTDPKIYRFVSGEWVEQTVSFPPGMICTTASGDGSFYLGDG